MTTAARRRLASRQHPLSIRLARLEEAITILRELWTGRTLTHEGTYFTVHNARLFTLPDEPPPLYVSGLGPEATALAAKVADGWMTTSPDKESLALFRETNRGRTQAGVKICWAATVEEAAEKMAEHVACGPDPEKAADASRPYLEAGFDEVFVSQMGPDQEGGLRFISEQVLPLLR